MPSSIPNVWTRREWLVAAIARTSAFAAVVPLRPRLLRKNAGARPSTRRSTPISASTTSSAISRTADPAQLQEIVRRAVEAARGAGARYADARLTRVVQHSYAIGGGAYAPAVSPKGAFSNHAALQLDTEQVGLGVRVLINGAWGFAAGPLWIGDPAGADAIAVIAKDAVRQAKATAGGSFPPVELTPVPAVTGHWSTPIKIDPFTIPIEEKIATAGQWKAQATSAGVQFTDSFGHQMSFTREERALATSDGTLITQVLYDTGGSITIQLLNAKPTRRPGGRREEPLRLPVDKLLHAGKGWELFDEANLVQQFEFLRDELPRRTELRDKARNETIGRYTIVCDGITMASLLEHTLGTATQLDRALSYEANASGTSFITDPLGMIGQLRLAPDTVTVTANRNAPSQLATVQWDDEGVKPQSFSLIEQGMLVDFQTTREQAAWLAPYYERIGRPVHSNGCAAAEDALFITMQHMPNLALEPVRTGGDIDALISTIKDGIYLERNKVGQIDFQGRTGLVAPAWGDMAARMRKISNGRLGEQVRGLSLMFDTVDFWKHITAVGNETTQATISTTGHDSAWSLYGVSDMSKGSPAQMSGHTVQAVAAIVESQPMIDPSRKA